MVTLVNPLNTTSGHNWTTEKITITVEFYSSEMILQWGRYQASISSLTQQSPHSMILSIRICMMKSSNANIFRVTGPLCGNSPVTGEFPAQRPMTRGFDVFFDLRLNKRLSKQSQIGDLRRRRANYNKFVPAILSVSWINLRCCVAYRLLGNLVIKPRTTWNQLFSELYWIIDFRLSCRNG